jgi:hypothetical protein
MFHGVHIMIKTLLAATTVAALMSGAAFAQMSSSTSTTVVTPGVAPIHHEDVTTTERRTESRDGVMVEKDTSGDTVDRPGTPTTTHTTSETTTVR